MVFLSEIMGVYWIGNGFGNRGASHGLERGVNGWRTCEEEQEIPTVG